VRAGVVAVVALVLVGCGGHSSAAPAPKRTLSLCEPARAAAYVVCGYPLQTRAPSEIWLRSEDGTRPVIRAAPVKNGHPPYPAGSWVADRLFLSPDGSLLLLQWSGECEAQSTWIVSASGGKPRPILPQGESRALGWARDGSARILLPRAVCGGNGDRPAGVYLVDPHTLKLTLVRRVKPEPGGP
jgi:hypothetical protein